MDALGGKLVDPRPGLRYKLETKMSRACGFAFGFYFAWPGAGAETIS